MNLTRKTKEAEIQSILLKWYKVNKRELPWRSLEDNNLPTSYYIFISEYMLQQTTVGTVKKRFEEFVQKWPSLNALALISNSSILSFWSGLGYYSRATNLLKAAKEIKKHFNSEIPDTYDELITLPGVGDYTAKAILGIAYNQPTMPLDANIERILARIYGLREPIKKIKKDLQLKSLLFISQKHSTKLIQAFMDYGSIICKPRNPDCSNCAINTYCVSVKKNLQHIIPVKIKKTNQKRKKYSRAYILYNEMDEILVRKRKAKGMLASMLEVPNDQWIANKKNLIEDKIIDKIKNKMIFKDTVKYSFSHFDLEIDVYYIKMKKNYFNNHQWIKKINIYKSSLPTVMKKIVEAAF